MNIWLFILLLYVIGVIITLFLIGILSNRNDSFEETDLAFTVFWPLAWSVLIVWCITRAFYVFGKALRYKLDEKESDKKCLSQYFWELL